jgi:hypothetical protein
MEIFRQAAPLAHLQRVTCAGARRGAWVYRSLGATTVQLFGVFNVFVGNAHAGVKTLTEHRLITNVSSLFTDRHSHRCWFLLE